MKTLLLCLLVAFNSASASDWVIHAALGTNPWIGFTRVAPDGLSIESQTFTYGTDLSFSVVADVWLSDYGATFYTNGPTLIMPESWGTMEIPYSPVYGSSSSVDWFIEGGPPGFLGGGSATGPETPGEYWIDFDSTGTIRISTTQLSDFGKWAWDGSINPSWTAAKKGFAKGHNKQPLPSPK